MGIKMKKFAPIIKDQPYMIYGGDYNPDQWLDRPDILKEDDRLMNLAKINNASVAIFAWKALEPEEGVYTFEWLDETMDRLAANGKKVILATPSGARPAWMDRKYPEVLRVNDGRVKNLHGERHNHCYTSPYYRRKVFEMNQMLAKRYKDHKALGMWHISNEYGGDCHCPLCQQAFRDWLRKKYDNDIDKLNGQWWTGFWSKKYSSFDEIESPAPQGERCIHGLNLDWLRFVTYQTTDFMEQEIKAVKEITPQIPVTTNLMGLYPGLNPWVMAKKMDVISWDNYPRWHTMHSKNWELASDIGFVHDINRCLKHKPFLLMESTPSNVNWQQVNKLKRPGMNILASMQAVAHGSDSVQYFQWRKGRGAAEKFHGAVVDHEGSENTRVFQEAAKLGEMLQKCKDIVGTCNQAKVAVIYDWENRWAIDNMNGLSDRRNYEETCRLHYRALWQKNVTVDVIDMEQDLSGYSLVIAPMLYMQKPGVAKRLQDFVSQGNTLVTTYFTGYVNENDLCFLGGFPGDGLKEVLGIWAEEIDSLYEADSNQMCFSSCLNTEDSKGELFASMSGKKYAIKDYCEIVHPLENTKVLAVYGEDFYEGTPALTCHTYGEGKAYHICARTDMEMLSDFYQELIAQCEVPVNLLGSYDEGVNVQKRESDGEAYYFIMNFEGKEAKVTLEEDIQLVSVIHETTIPKSFVLKPYEVIIAAQK